MARRSELVCILMILLCGCEAQGTRYKKQGAAEGEGTILVYRPKGDFIGRGENPYVTVNGESLGHIFAGAYIAKTVPAGEHDVKVVQSLVFLPVWAKGVTVAVGEGGTAYVKVDQKITSLGGENSGIAARQEIFIEEVDEVAGQAALAKSRRNE